MTSDAGARAKAAAAHPGLGAGTAMTSQLEAAYYAQARAQRTAELTSQ